MFQPTRDRGFAITTLAALYKVGYSQLESAKGLRCATEVLRPSEPKAPCP